MQLKLIAESGQGATVRSGERIFDDRELAAINFQMAEAEALLQSAAFLSELTDNLGAERERKTAVSCVSTLVRVAQQKMRAGMEIVDWLADGNFFPEEVEGGEA